MKFFFASRVVRFALGSLVLSVFLPGVVLSAEFGGIGGKPANIDPTNTRSKQWFVYTLKPGEKKEDELLVQNNSNEGVDLVIYAADSTPSTDGGFALEQMVEERNNVGAWIKLSQTEVHLESFESKKIPFTLTMPSDPKLDVGEHAGGIIIQRKEVPTESQGLQLSTRVGVRVYVTVPGEIIKNMEVEKLSYEFNKDQNKYTAVFTVHNSGNVSQDLSMEVTVTTAHAWWPKFLLKNMPLENKRNLQALRGSSLTSNVEFQKPFFGKLKLEAAAFADGQRTIQATPVYFWVWPGMDVLLAVGLGILLIGLVIVLLLIKRNERKKTTRRKKRRA